MLQLSLYKKNNTIELNYNSFEIRTEIAEIKSLFQLDADQKNIQLLERIDIHTPESIIQDKSALWQLLFLVISNSMKYTLKGYISIYIHYNIHLQRLYIEIEDSGIGISEKDQQHLFTMYSDAYLENSEFGTGIGLSLCKAIITSMKGEIELFSTLGEGTKVIIEIPAVSAEEMCEIAHPIETFASYTENSSCSSNCCIKSIGGYQINRHPQMFQTISDIIINTQYEEIKGMEGDLDIVNIENIDTMENSCNCPTILIVDDIPSNIFVLRGMLEIMGRKADIASNGQEAIEKIQKAYIERECCHNYSIILMDCNMPIMDGYIIYILL